MNCKECGRTMRKGLDLFWCKLFTPFNAKAASDIGSGYGRGPYCGDCVIRSGMSSGEEVIMDDVEWEAGYPYRPMCRVIFIRPEREKVVVPGTLGT